jgi:hypothetical protein
MTHLKSIGKSILTGGAAAGVISLIPIVNFLNLLFMMWMAFGGGLCVYMLLKANRSSEIHVSAVDALVSGALSGVLGWVIFGSVSFLLVSHISPEKMEQIITILEMFSPSAGENVGELLQGNELIRLFFLVMAIALIFSVISGSLGGVISRLVFKKEAQTITEEELK